MLFFVIFKFKIFLFLIINNGAYTNKVDLDKIITSKDSGRNFKTAESDSNLTLNNSHSFLLKVNKSINKDDSPVYINQLTYNEFFVDFNGDIFNGSSSFDATIKKSNSTIHNDISNKTKEDENTSFKNETYVENQENNDFFFETDSDSKNVETNHTTYPNIGSSNLEEGANIVSVSFSTIYYDLLSDPDLKDNVEYTIFNTSDKEKRKLIESQLKKSDVTNIVLNINDISSYGFISWIRPVTRNSLELIFQSSSGILENTNIKFFKSLFPRRNFTNDELDIIILSESSQEVRPYGYRGSPIILTQYIENIFLNIDEEDESDIIALMETIDVLNQTKLIDNNETNNNGFNSKIEENATFKNSETDIESNHKYWINSFLLHDDPDLLSINCDFYTEWSSWSSCTNECGWGIQTRGRRIDANKAFKKSYVSMEEHSKELDRCKVQIQTQGCSSKSGCCEYTRPKEDSWGNCSATYGRVGFEEQLVQLVSDRKGNVSDKACAKEKTIKRKCLKIIEDDNFCSTTEWSEWSACENGDGNYVQRRERKLTSNNCTKDHITLNEDRICDYLPTISNSPTQNEESNDSDYISENLEYLNYEDKFHRIEECLFVISETKYKESIGSCECPEGMKICSANTVENLKSSWEHHANQICSEMQTGFNSSKGKLLQAIGNRTFNCESKVWEKYNEKKSDSDCINTFVLCKLENNCIVSSWSGWSGCSSPCKYHSSNSFDNISSFRMRARTVVSGSCSEHLLMEKEECSNLVECPQTSVLLHISKKPKEIISEIFKEENKEALKVALNFVKEYDNIEYSISSVAKALFNEVKNIIINNTVYLLNVDLNEKVIGADGKYHKGNFIDSLLSNFDLIDKDLVSNIVSEIFINGKVSDELYNNLTLKDKSIIGDGYPETAEFISKLFSSLKNYTENHDYSSMIKESFNKSNIPTEMNSSNSELIVNNNSTGTNLEDSHDEILISNGDLYSEFNKNNQKGIKDKFFDKINDIFGYLSSKYRSDLNKTSNESNSIEPNVIEEESKSVDLDLYKILNGTVLINLIEHSIISHSNCKPMEVARDELEQTESKTNCKCPTGYILCSSIDYLFGNKTINISQDPVNIGSNLGVFSDNFVLNKGDLYQAIYESDKESYCLTQHAIVMCSSKSELIKSFENHDIFNLYSENFHLKGELSGEE
ncbi:hypothetical protein FG386_000446 [Cryptosporidium ryanae]|uniref:uncharacterized protein n=1 Tax=Cryptosporidium ryanae TaxID=515981 RepID=UPI00351A29D5|nr:hypothetical protein FG386_000446 [Cryptosporidium ryanae]